MVAAGVHIVGGRVAAAGDSDRGAEIAEVGRVAGDAGRLHGIGTTTGCPPGDRYVSALPRHRKNPEPGRTVGWIGARQELIGIADPVAIRVGSVEDEDEREQGGLPAPFGPTCPMRSPRLTCRDASSKSTRAPKALVIPEIANI